MSLLRRMDTDDLFRFNSINLDPLTETYAMPFYLQYKAKWPSLCLTVEGTDRRLAGYIIGKTEGIDPTPQGWHGHVTAITVACEYRRLGIAKFLMEALERVSATQASYFVDLYVRASNAVAIDMYKKLGYVVYRIVMGYYSGEEDAYDMRKALALDTSKKSMIPRKPLKCMPSDTD